MPVDIRVKVKVFCKLLINMPYYIDSYCIKNTYMLHVLRHMRTLVDYKKKSKNAFCKSDLHMGTPYAC